MSRVLVLVLFYVLSFAEPVRVGLCLSGGGALGLAHIGVLKVLEQNGIDFVGVSGNSMGALVGGVYAAGYSAAQIESIALSADWNRLFSSNPGYGAQYLPEKQLSQRYVLRLRHRRFIPYLPSGLVPLQNVEFLLNRLLAEVEFNSGYNFDSLPVSYRAVAVDLNAGEKVVLKKGRLEQAIRASIAIPGVFSPEVVEGRELVDGGVLDYMPVEALSDFQPDLVIAVLTMRKVDTPGQSLVDIASRSIDLMSIGNVERAKRLADVVIEPEVSRFLHSDFSRVKELIAAGESAAMRALPLIREKLRGRVPVQVRKPVAPRRLPFVRKIRIVGLKRTRKSLVLPYVRIREGSRLNFEAVLSGLERLFNTGLFEDVNFHLESLDSDSGDLVYELNERPFGFYSVGIRYDSKDNVVLGGEVGEENILGSGAAVRVAGVAGNPNEFRLGITGTRVFQLLLGYRLDGYISSLSRNCYDNGQFKSSYFVRFIGGVAEAGYITGRNGFFNFGVRAEQVRYVGEAVDSLKPGWLSGIMFNLEFNNQDRLDLAERGVSYRFNWFYSSPKVFSQEEFLKLEFKGEQLVPIIPKLGLRFWSLVGLSFGRLLLCEQFLSGGERFAGFAEEEFRSDHRLIIGTAFRWRIMDLLNLRDYPLYLEALGNIGSFTGLDSLFKYPGVVDNLHWGVGAGFLTDTPIGPLRAVVSLGDFFKPTPHPGGVRVYLSLGKEFRYGR